MRPVITLGRDHRRGHHHRRLRRLERQRQHHDREGRRERQGRRQAQHGRLGGSTRTSRSRSRSRPRRAARSTRSRRARPTRCSRVPLRRRRAVRRRHAVGRRQPAASSSPARCSPSTSPKLVHYKDLAPQLQSPAFNTQDGKHYGLSFMWGADVLIYNADKIKTPPTSWAALLPEVQGQGHDPRQPDPDRRPGAAVLRRAEPVRDQPGDARQGRGEAQGAAAVREQYWGLRPTSSGCSSPAKP